jgi:hypothetical protein
MGRQMFILNEPSVAPAKSRRVKSILTLKGTVQNLTSFWFNLLEIFQAWVNALTTTPAGNRSAAGAGPGFLYGCLEERGPKQPVKYP